MSCFVLYMIHFAVKLVVQSRILLCRRTGSGYFLLKYILRHCEMNCLTYSKNSEVKVQVSVIFL